MHRGLLLLLLALGCGNDTRSELPSAADRFPRLTHAQWETTVKDLFRLPAESGLSATFTPDPQLGRFDNNIARLTLTSGLWRDYQQAAETIADRVLDDAALYDALAGGTTDVRQWIAAFGMRAFRRPLKDAEIERYAQLFDGAHAVFPQHDAFKAGVRLVVQGMLQSPFFLYRTELSAVRQGYGYPLDNFEVASRLSFLFWNSMPDDELFAAAQAGELATAEGVRRHAQRLLDDPRTQAQFRRFHYQAFAISEYADLDKSTEVFPSWRREIGAMMQEEALRFLDHVVASGGGVSELLLSRTAYVNADLARIYGLEGEYGDDYVLAELPPDRAGLLTRAGFLARNATLDEPDPIHRGVFINLGILCRPITAPPNIPEMLERTGNTNRERVTSITGPGTCGENCHHTIINPLGFAFESFDAVGASRTTDNGFPVDTAAVYQFVDGRTISYGNAVELSQQLAASPEVHACYAQQLLEFMLGRDLQMLDRVVVDQLAVRSLADQLSIEDLVLDVVSSNTFRARLQRSEP
jgi:hypothetical protein